MTPEPTTLLERAQYVAHLMGGNGLNQNQQVALIAAKLEEWSKADNAECDRNFTSTVNALIAVQKEVGNDDRVPYETYQKVTAIIDAWETAGP